MTLSSFAHSSCALRKRFRDSNIIRIPCLQHINKIISQLYPLLRTLQTLLIPIFEILSLHIIELRLNGGTVSKIYINGRELHDRTELSSLQATDIENVEILPEADLQYNATTKGGIIYIFEKMQMAEAMVHPLC